MPTFFYDYFDPPDRDPVVFHTVSFPWYSASSLRVVNDQGRLQYGLGDTARMDTQNHLGFISTKITTFPTNGDNITLLICLPETGTDGIYLQLTPSFYNVSSSQHGFPPIMFDDTPAGGLSGKEIELSVDASGLVTFLINGVVINTGQLSGAHMTYFFTPTRTFKGLSTSANLDVVLADVLAGIHGGAPEPEPELPEGRTVTPGIIDGGCILGCAVDYTVLVTSRCGQQTVCELTNISDMEYGRVLDDTSEAIIVMDLTGDSEGTCCDCIGGIRSWIHSVMILRDGELVWGPGAITNVLYRMDQVVVTARDVSAWLDVRMIHNDLDFFDEDPLVIAQAVIDDAMAPDDPCGIAAGTFIQPPAVLGVIDRSYTAEDPSQYAGDAFRELARTSMDYTVIGSTILMGEPLTFGPYTTLTDKDFQVELEIEERGLEAATKWVVQSDLARGEAGGLDPFYGLIEQLAEESQIEDDDQAALVATNRLVASNPVPLYLNIPDGARLSPEAPVCFEQLVPGTLVNVNVRNLCREVFTQMKLTAVRVHVSDGDEEVGITLSPLGTAFQEAGAI